MSLGHNGSAAEGGAISQATASSNLLIAAIQAGADEVVKVYTLLTNISINDVNAQDSNGKTALMHAALLKRTELFKALLNAGANPDIKDNQQKTIFKCAGEIGGFTLQVSFLEAMLLSAAEMGNQNLFLSTINFKNKNKRIVSVNARDNQGRTALMLAARSKKEELFKAILPFSEKEKGLDIIDKGGKTALMHAIEAGFTTKCIEEILKTGANIFIEDNENKTALICAKDTDNKELYKILWEVNFLYAARDGDLARVKSLASLPSLEEYGIEVRDTEDGINKTALMYAANSSSDNSYSMIRFLVDVLEFNINAKDNDGDTVLMYLIDSNNVSGMSYILNKGANANNQDNDSKTIALIYAAEKNSTIEVFKSLVEVGRANPNCKDNQGRIALMLAAENSDNVAVVEYLLSAGSSVDEKDENGQNALMYAVQIADNIDVLRCLVEKGGAQLNYIDKEGRTALMLAAESGQLEMVNYLLVKGADASISDNAGKKVLDYAKVEERGDIRELLGLPAVLEDASISLAEIEIGLPKT